MLAVRRHLRYGLSYRDVEDSSPNAAWRSTMSPSTDGSNDSPPCSHDAAGLTATPLGDRWFVDETYVKVDGVWRYGYRAVDQHGQVIDVYVSKRRNRRG